VSFIQRSLALFFGELPGPQVTVSDARETVEGSQEKGLRVIAPELGYTAFWFVRSRVWHAALPGQPVRRSVVPASAVIYQVGTEIVGDLLRIAQGALLAPGGDRARIESLARGYEGFLQHNIPQGLASLKAYEGVERARALLEELRNDFRARAAAGQAPAPVGAEQLAAAPAPAGQAPVGGPPPPVHEPRLEEALETTDIELTYDAETIAWPPVVPEAPPVLPDPAEVAPTPLAPPAAETVAVVPQTTAGYTFDPELVNLLGRLGSAHPWLIPDYGRQGEGMGVRVTLPAGLSVVFTHLGPQWSVGSSPVVTVVPPARLADDEAVAAWAIAQIRELTLGYAATIAAQRPADAAQLYQRVADLSG